MGKQIDITGLFNHVMQNSSMVKQIATELEHFSNALRVAFEKYHPEVVEEVERQMFKQRATAVMIGTMQLERTPRVPLDLIMKNKKALEEMKAVAEEKGWLSLFHKAQREANHHFEETDDQEEGEGAGDIIPGEEDEVRI